ncbi:MAG: hypothetical protein U0793_16025 [Gemmataceae bacterium]
MPRATGHVVPLDRRLCSRRRGLTLFEVVVALFIFLGGMAALYQLIQDSSLRAARINFKAQASLRCQSKLAEVLVGAVSLDSTDFQAFPDNAAWQWRMQATEQFTGLYQVFIEVKRDLPGADMVKSGIAQLVMPPSSRGSSFDTGTAPSAASKSGSDSSSGMSGSSGSTGSSGSSGASGGATGGTTGGGAAGGGAGKTGGTTTPRTGGSTGGATGGATGAGRTAPATTPTTPAAPATTPSTKGGGKG